ncbi:uncharacterized protein C4orf36 homolog [Otolemur garnettii]|uniref:uncharacterized protein C4orf36 homolog n=1 Tax=Otolemur garnettii TaxID=30611 RepID=UPI0002740B8C|nr:uncharacterized protein C4orf36 homolog [Otolemur garnettii]
MAYGLPRKNTVKNIFRGSCFKVQEPWDLALLTKSWYANLAAIKLPFLEEIAFGSPIKLAGHKAKGTGLLPSAESIRLEREYELKRLNELKHENDTCEEMQLSLRERPFGLRRPLPPGERSSCNQICTLLPPFRRDGSL